MLDSNVAENFLPETGDLYRGCAGVQQGHMLPSCGGTEFLSVPTRQCAPTAHDVSHPTAIASRSGNCQPKYLLIRGHIVRDQGSGIRDQGSPGNNGKDRLFSAVAAPGRQVTRSVEFFGEQAVMQARSYGPSYRAEKTSRQEEVHYYP